jgi:hypothetical protein
MNKKRTIETFAFTAGENYKSFFRFLKNLFAVKGISFFDVFAYSNTYQVKLPIIYANIRV